MPRTELLNNCITVALLLFPELHNSCITVVCLTFWQLRSHMRHETVQAVWEDRTCDDGYQCD